MWALRKLIVWALRVENIVLIFFWSCEVKVSNKVSNLSSLERSYGIYNCNQQALTIVQHSACKSHSK